MKILKEKIEQLIKENQDELEKKEVGEGEGTNSYNYFLGIDDILHKIIKEIDKRQTPQAGRIPL